MKKETVQAVPERAKEGIEAATRDLLAWIESEEFLGWDPYDALRSPLLRPLGRLSRWLGVAIVQLFKSSPWNPRPLFGIDKAIHPKGIGLLLTAYLRLRREDPESLPLGSIEMLVQLLESSEIRTPHGLGWGFPFDWPNRSDYVPAGTPTIVNTAYIANAFLDYYRQSQDDLGLKKAIAACEFILEDLNRPQAGEQTNFSYTPLDHRWVHNANALGAWLLARTGRLAGVERYLEAASAALESLDGHQRGDGSWWYGAAERDHFIDHYHTGMLLVARAEANGFLNRDDESGEAGFAYYRDSLFDPELRPKYHPARLYPIDVHCVAQGILTFLCFPEVKGAGLKGALRLAQWAIAEMRDPGGFFHYQIHGTYRITIPYLRWGQAWMLNALSALMAGMGTQERVGS